MRKRLFYPIPQTKIYAILFLCEVQNLKIKLLVSLGAEHKIQIENRKNSNKN